MTNNEILNILLERGTDSESATHSVNALNAKKYLPMWNNEEGLFPHEELEKYIRMNEWTKEDFNYDTELVLKDTLPPFVLDIFFEVKDFRSDHRNELLSTQEVFARLYGYPYNTQDEKAFCVFKCAFQEYLNASRLNQGE
jgi:hypothetical protein